MFVVIHNQCIGRPYWQKVSWHTPYLIMKMSVNGASMIFGHATWVFTPPLGCRQSYRNYRPPLSAIQIAIPSLPHLQNERQLSVNDCWSCILGQLGGDRLQTVINGVLATFIGKKETETLPALTWKWVSTECQRLLAFHHGWSQRDVAIMVYIHRFDCFCIVKGSSILSSSSVNEIRSCFPRGCRGNILYISANTGCHTLVYECLISSAPHVTEHARPNIVDTPLTFNFRIYWGMWVCSFYALQQPIRQR